LLTLPNIQYIVQGLDVLLQNNLDGDNRIRAFIDSSYVCFLALLDYE
jgi:hypothetical protein